MLQQAGPSRPAPELGTEELLHWDTALEQHPSKAHVQKAYFLVKSRTPGNLDEISPCFWLCLINPVLFLSESQVFVLQAGFSELDYTVLWLEITFLALRARRI